MEAVPAGEVGTAFLLISAIKIIRCITEIKKASNGAFMCAKWFTEALYSNTGLMDRKKDTEIRLSSFVFDLEKELQEIGCENDLSIFSAGSIGRSEVGKKSDIDPFLLVDSSALDDELSYIKVIINKISNRHGFPDVTDDFFKIYLVKNLLAMTGKREDDHENTFTTRVLMLLESVPIYNKEAYYSYRNKIVENYFRDSYGRTGEFKPVFLMNDFLRYWRTVCLNYERLRDDPARPWRKKNINLKFARRFTIFSTILPMISLPIRSIGDFIEICNKTPMERLACGLDQLGDDSLIPEFIKILENYETFLKLKEEDDVEKHLDIVNPRIKEMDEFNKKFLFKALMHDRVAEEYKQFLVM